MKQRALLPARKTFQRWRWQSSLIDSALALGGVAFVTCVIALVHLYPRIPTISFAYLLVVLALASWRGLVAAILASLLGFVSYLFFFVPPLYTFLIPRVEDLLTLVVFLVTAIITGQLASTLRWRAEQAQTREREMRLLYAQAREAVLRTRYRLTVNEELGAEPDLPLDQKEALYRIAQEALHNTVKHARATTVTLCFIESPAEFLLEVRDDGKGFDSTGLFPGHLGLRSMQERITRVGGTLAIRSAPGQGTCVKARLPLAER